MKPLTIASRVIPGIVLLSGLVLGGPSVPSDSLTLDQVINMAVRNSPLVTQAMAGVRAAEARAGQIRTYAYPSVDFEAGYTRLGPASQLEFPGLGAFRLYPEGNFDAHVGARQTVYDFGKVSASVEVSNSRVETSRQNIDLAKFNLAYQTAQTFHTILYLRQSMTVQEEEIQTLKEHLEINRKRAEAGTVTEFDVLTTQVRVAGAENQRIELQNNIERQEIALRRLIGLAPTAPVEVQGTFAVGNATFDADSLIEHAVSQRVEFKTLQDEEKTASLQYHLVTVGDYPALNVMAMWGLKNAYFPDLDVLRGNWVAGVQVAVPLYEGGRTEQKKEEAQANIESVRANMADLKERLGAEVRQALSDVQAAVGKFATSELQVRQAREALSIARKRYEAGAISNLDLLDAETSLSHANLQRLQVLYSYVLSRLGLDRAIGTRLWGPTE